MLREIDPMFIGNAFARNRHIHVVHRDPSQRRSQFLQRRRQIDTPPHQLRQRNRRDHPLICFRPFPLRAAKHRAPPTRLNLHQLGIVRELLNRREKRFRQHLDAATDGILEGWVVAEGLVLDSQGAVDDIFDIGLRHQPRHPVGREFVKRHLPQFLVERHHEMFCNAFAQTVDDPLFERSAFRRRRGRWIRQGGDESQQTFPHHFRRKAMRIHLERILGIRLVGIDI